MKMLVHDIAKLKSDGSLEWVMPVFPYSDRYPFAPEKVLDQLSKDIQINGLKNCLWLWVNDETNEKIFLDGRNRLKAMLRIPNFDEEVEVQEFYGSELEAAEFVVSLNIHGRHIDSSQKAFLALDYLPYEEEKARGRQLALAGSRPNSDLESPGDSRSKRDPQARDLVAEIFSVSPTYITYAKKLNENVGVIEEAAGLKERVMLADGETGKMSLKEAYNFLMKVIEDNQRLLANQALEAERKAADREEEEDSDGTWTEDDQGNWYPVEKETTSTGDTAVTRTPAPSEAPTTPKPPKPAKPKKSDAVLRAEHWKEVSTIQMKTFNEKIPGITATSDIETIWSLLENIRHHADISFAALESHRVKLEDDDEEVV